MLILVDQRLIATHHPLDISLGLREMSFEVIKFIKEGAPSIHLRQAIGKELLVLRAYKTRLMSHNLVAQLIYGMTPIHVGTSVRQGVCEAVQFLNGLL